MQAIWLTSLHMELSYSSNGGNGKSRNMTVCRLIIPEIGTRITFTDAYIRSEQPDKLFWKDEEIVATFEMPPELVKRLDTYVRAQRVLIDSLVVLQDPLKKVVGD